MNQAVRKIAAGMGLMLGLAEMTHATFEALQGNAPTSGLIIQAIGPAQRMWVHGTEEALTLIPNYLATGLLGLLVSLAIIVWSVRFLDRKHGPTVLILLFMLSVLVGGGIAQVVFFTLAWALATRIHSSLGWLRKLLPERLRRWLAPLWSFSLAAVLILFLCALEIAVWGQVPGIQDPELKLHLCWSLLGLALVLNLFTCLAGVASDLQAKQKE